MPLRRVRFFSLRTRFMALAVLLTVGSSSIWGLWAWNREKALLEEGLSREGRMLVSSMAIPIMNALLYEELGIIAEGGLLDNFVADIMGNRQLRPFYAMVFDQEGRVIAHNRLSEYGRLYDDPLTRRALAAEGPGQSPVSFEGKNSLDFSVPLAIGGKRWGALRVGVPTEPLDRELRRLAGQILFFAITFSLGALGIFYLVGSGLSRPLKVLARRMEQVDEGTLPAIMSSGRQDEIGQLEESFRRMVERLRRSEAERQASLARMLESERMIAVGKIASGVAHEVNNPLAGIQGALYHIEQKGGAGVKRYTCMVEASVERIRRIVAQLLDLTRAGAMEMEEVGSRDFFQELVLFARMALKGRCRLEEKDLCRPKVLRVDRDKVHQVVLNLVLNSADAAGPDGWVEVQAYDFDGWYCLSIHDSGPGVPAEIADRIFEPFFTTKEPGKGTGMGLAISRSIAEAHGGRLDLRADSAGGTAFNLMIPLPERRNDRAHSAC